jgi:molecular chaperone GrpE
MNMQDDVNSKEQSVADSAHQSAEQLSDNVADAAKVDEEIIEELLADDQSSEVEELKQKISEANDQVLRIQAEMQNVRRRTERDVENAHKYALDKFTADLLPVVDNLERAIATIDVTADAQKDVATGLELTLKTFTDVLLRFKVEVVDPAGQPFDADLHQAVSMVPNPDLEPNTVMDVFQKGYTLNGRLVRPAMVVVSKGS